MFKLSNFKNLDIVLLFCTLLLCIIGGLTVFSTTYSKSGVSKLFYNQILFYVVGFCIMFGISLIDYKFFKRRSVLVLSYFFTIAMLLAVLQYGDIINGARRWIDFYGFTLQPSEFAKIIIILVSSFLLTYKIQDTFASVSTNNPSGIFKNAIENKKFLRSFMAVLSVGLVMMLVLAQKSLGNTILIFLIFTFICLSLIELDKSILAYIFTAAFSIGIGMGILNLEFLYDYLNINLIVQNIDLGLIAIFIILSLVFAKLSQINNFWLILIFLVFLPTFSLLQITYNNVLQPYQRNRIETFINPKSENSLTLDWNRDRSIIAVGSGQIFGNGFLKGNQVSYRLLPFAYTDFVFAAFAEQFGFVGSLVLIAIYIVMLNKILAVYNSTDDSFGKSMCIGIFALILLNTMQNIGMNIGLLPITGVPLPLISYGGSSILTIFVGLGLIQSMAMDVNSRSEEIIKIVV